MSTLIDLRGRVLTWNFCRLWDAEFCGLVELGLILTILIDWLFGLTGNVTRASARTGRLSSLLNDLFSLS